MDNTTPADKNELKTEKVCEEKVCEEKVSWLQGCIEDSFMSRNRVLKGYFMKNKKWADKVLNAFIISHIMEKVLQLSRGDAFLL